MNVLKSPAPVIGAILVAALATSPFWLPRPLRNAGAKPVVESAGTSNPATQVQVEAGHTDKGTPAVVAVQIAGLSTSDQLVAIYESKGAAAALAAAKGMTGSERASQVVFILTYLARIDPEFVAGELKGAGLDTVHQGFIVDAVMNEWKDGKKALEWATSNFTGDLLKRAVGGALRILVKTDADAALAYVDTLPASGFRSQAIADIFSTWGGFDPGAALKVISGNFSDADRVSAISSLISSWSHLHPAEAAAWVLTVQDEKQRATLIAGVARSWRFKSPDEATAWVESLPEGPGKEAGRAVFQEKVTTIVCGMGNPGPDVGWKTKTVATMGSSDFWNWAIQDPEGARKFVETAPEGKDLTDLAAATAYQISTKEGYESAFAWAQTLPGESGKSALRCTVISWAGSDPAAAAKKLEAIAPEQRAPLTTALTENWAQHDPANAAAWVATYDGAEQKLLVREVLQRWTDSQPREAYAWLGTLPTGPSRDEGIDYLLRIEARTDPKSVLPWIDLISEPKLRERQRKELDWWLQRAGK